MAGFGLREWHVRHSHYLGVATFPQAHFRSDRVQIKDDTLTFEGTLDLHGVKRAVTLSGKMVGNLISLDIRVALKRA